MRALVLHSSPGRLSCEAIPDPVPGPGEVLLAVHACAVCRTDLHLIDGELPDPMLPVVPGHEIVGRVIANGPGASRFRVGDRVGVPWLASACGQCGQCRAGRENLCPNARFTGYTHQGGFAERTVADERFCFPLPEGYSDAEAAPLLCAGLIGYRALRFAGEAHRIGLYGFGAAAHIIAQVAQHQGREILAFTSPGDTEAQDFARSLGAVWAGGSDEPSPLPLDAALIFAPVGALVPAALRSVAPGGTVVCAGIHMSDIPSFPYRDLWRERIIRSVTNLTRRDGDDFLALAGRMRIRTQVQTRPLAEGQAALDALRAGKVHGAEVLLPGA
jgi:alcohol dehydrogenase, propanol-preferring